MWVKQISVFLENTSGRIAEVTGTLAAAGVNIRALAMADTADFGVLRLIVDNTAKAEAALKAKGFTVGKTDVVAAEVEDRPGGLHRILQLLHEGQINVEYMYAFVQQSGNNAVMIFRFDQIEKAVALLRQNGVTVIDDDRIYQL
jgi:hypothetical protein